MRAWGRGVTWWARTAQKSGSRLLPNAAVPVRLSSAFKSEPWPRTKIWLWEHRGCMEPLIQTCGGRQLHRAAALPTLTPARRTGHKRR